MTKGNEPLDGEAVTSALAAAVADTGLLDAVIREIASQVAELAEWAVEQLPGELEIPSNSEPPTVRFPDGLTRSGVLVLRRGEPAHWVLAVNEPSPSRRAGSSRRPIGRPTQHSAYEPTGLGWPDDQLTPWGDRY